MLTAPLRLEDSIGVDNSMDEGLYLLEDWPVEVFIETMIPIPDNIRSKVDLTHYLLSKWHLLSSRIPVEERRLSFLPIYSNSSREYPKPKKDGTTFTPFVNMALDYKEGSPQNLIPIPGTNFTICRYPAREVIRTYLDGVKGTKEVGFCMLILVDEEIIEQ